MDYNARVFSDLVLVIRKGLVEVRQLGPQSQSVGHHSQLLADDDFCVVVVVD